MCLVNSQLWANTVRGAGWYKEYYISFDFYNSALDFNPVLPYIAWDHICVLTHCSTGDMNTILKMFSV